MAPRAAAIDSTGEFPSDVIRAAAGLGLLGLTVSTTWGGAGRDYLSYALAIESIGRASATVATSLAVTNSLVAELIEHAGTDAQRDRWLRTLTGGETVGAFALSEAGAGTDAANQQTTATRVEGGYRLVGRKVWVANAAAAGVIVVFAATRPGQRGKGVSAFSWPATRRESREPTGRFSWCARLGCMDLDLDVTVPSDQLLGGVDEGFGLAMWALQGGRASRLRPGAWDRAGRAGRRHRARQTREQFGRPIAQFEAIQWMIADAATELDAARMLMWKAASVKARGEPGAVESSMAKLAASEAAHHAADKAMQVLASAGYRRGSVVERLFRDVRATEIYQGTSEAQRMIIAKHLSR